MISSTIRTILLTALAAAIWAALASPAGAVLVSGSVTTSDPTRTFMSPSGAPSSCDLPVQQGQIVASSHHYDAWSFTNSTTSPQCVTVTLQINAGSNDATSEAYSSLNRLDPSANLLGTGNNGCADLVGSGSGYFYSFNVAAGASFLVTVTECFLNQGVASYAMDVSVSGNPTAITGGTPLAVSFRSLAARATGQGMRVSWRTASEVDSLGFHVYREAKGRRVRVTRTLIPAKDRGLYSFVDRRTPRGTRVRYWVQEIELDGSRTWHGPTRFLRGS